MKDDLSTLDEEALARLGADLGVVPRAPGELLEAFRARVALRFDDDAAVLAAETAPTGLVLGGMKLGG